MLVQNQMALAVGALRSTAEYLMRTVRVKIAHLIRCVSEESFVG